jgi:hypothetical protein
MRSADGYNPMGWQCDRDGCFNKKMRPKIEEFARCLPGRIAFSDVDGIVEINGRFLMLEWKSRTPSLPAGQRIMYSRMTTNPLFRVLVIHGDAETMEVTRYGEYAAGQFGGWTDGDLESLKAYVRCWAAWAKDAA